MPKTWGTVEKKLVKPTANYYAYSDGHSYWGLSLMRNNEFPLLCSQAEHILSIEEKIKWHGEEFLRLDALAKEEASKKKKTH
jgi:hypothetical protein